MHILKKEKKRTSFSANIGTVTRIYRRHRWRKSTATGVGKRCDCLTLFHFSLIAMSRTRRWILLQCTIPYIYDITKFSRDFLFVLETREKNNTNLHPCRHFRRHTVICFSCIIYVLAYYVTLSLRCDETWLLECLAHCDASAGVDWISLEAFWLQSPSGAIQFSRLSCTDTLLFVARNGENYTPGFYITHFARSISV